MKPTDARSYLHYTSAHPRHTFSGIVYSQCLHLRRIINDQDRLKSRLIELCSAFEKFGYPKNMLMNISTKVLNMSRQIERIQSTEESNSKPILVVSSYGTSAIKPSVLFLKMLVFKKVSSLFVNVLISLSSVDGKTY